MQLQPSAFADRSIFLKRMGNPKDWSGDWRRTGCYLNGNAQVIVQQRLSSHQMMIVGMAVRQVPSKLVAAVMGVSRESIDRRLRPLGLKNEAGQVGRPPRARAAWGLT